MDSFAMDLFKRRKAVNPVTDVEVLEKEYSSLQEALESEISIGSLDSKVTEFTLSSGASVQVFTVAGAVRLVQALETPLNLGYALYWLEHELVTEELLEKIAGEDALGYARVVAEEPALAPQVKKIFEAYTLESLRELQSTFDDVVKVRTELVNSTVAEALAESTYFSKSVSETAELAADEASAAEVAAARLSLDAEADVILSLLAPDASATSPVEHFILEAARNSSSLAAAKNLASGFRWRRVLEALEELVLAGTVRLSGTGVSTSTHQALPAVEALSHDTATHPITTSAFTLQEDDAEEVPETFDTFTAAHSDEESEELSAAWVDALETSQDAATTEEPPAAEPSQDWDFTIIVPEESTPAEEAFEAPVRPTHDDGGFTFERVASLPEEHRFTGALDVPLKRLLTRAIASNFMTEAEEHRLMQLSRRNEQFENSVERFEEETLSPLQLAYYEQSPAHFAAVAEASTPEDEDELNEQFSEVFDRLSSAEEKRFSLNQERRAVLHELREKVEPFTGEAAQELRDGITAKESGMREATNLAFVDPTTPPPVEEPEELSEPTLEEVVTEEEAVVSHEDEIFAIAVEEAPAATLQQALVEELNEVLEEAPASESNALEADQQEPEEHQEEAFSEAEVAAFAPVAPDPVETEVIEVEHLFTAEDYRGYEDEQLHAAEYNFVEEPDSDIASVAAPEKIDPRETPLYAALVRDLNFDPLEG
jgi:hypothetical protein